MDSEWCIVCEAKILSSSDAVPSSSAFCSSSCLLKAQSDARSRSTSPVLFPPGGGPSRSRRSTGSPSTHRMASYASAWVRRAGGAPRPSSPHPTTTLHEDVTTTTTSDLDSDAEDEDEGLQIRGRPRHRRFWDDSSEGGAPSLSTLNTSATDEGSGGGNKREEDLTVRRPSKAPRLNSVEERTSDGPSPTSGTSTAGAPSPATTGPPFLSMSAPPPPPPQQTASSGARSQIVQDGRSSSASSSPTHPLHLSRRARSSADRLASFLSSIGRPPSAPRGSTTNNSTSSHRHASRPSEGGNRSDDADVSEDLSAVADAFMAWGGVVSSSPSASLATSNRSGGGKKPATVVGGDEVQAIHESVFRRHKERRPAPGRKAGVVSPKGWGLVGKAKPAPSANPPSSKDPAGNKQQQQQVNGSTTPIAVRSSSPALMVGRGRDEGQKDINPGTGDLLSRIEDAVGGAAEGTDERGREEVKERGRDAAKRRISSSGSRGRQAEFAPGTAAAG